MVDREQNALIRFVRRIVASGDIGDRQLLERFNRAGDEEAFAALVQRHGPMVFGVCRRLLDDVHAAEDCFQATFLILASRARAVRPTAGQIPPAVRALLPAAGRKIAEGLRF